MNETTPSPRKTDARQKLLDAAVALIRERGYAASTVDELCARAGVTKGAFFHHFRSKDDLGEAVARYWSEMTGAFFAAAPYHRLDDPLARFLGYLDFRKAILRGEVAEFTCLAGTLVQEIHQSCPAIRDACEEGIRTHAERLIPDIAEAMRRHGLQTEWTAESLAFHTQAVLQGAFILAKAQGGAEVAAASVDHLRRYVELLFHPTPQTDNKET